MDRLVAVITVDCYNLAEPVTAFYETFTEEVPLPTDASVVGTTIQVVGVDIAEHGQELIARCQRGDVVQDLRLSDLVFAPDTTAGWIHAAYRRSLGLMPHPAAVPEGWKPSGCDLTFHRCRDHAPFPVQRASHEAVSRGPRIGGSLDQDHAP